MDCTIRVAKTKALISFTVTAKLICVFVFAYAKSRFSHNEAHLKQETKKLSLNNHEIPVFLLYLHIKEKKNDKVL